MLRKFRPAAATLAASAAVLALAASVATAPAADAAAASAVSPAACTASFPIVLDGFAFTPATVAPGTTAAV